MIIYIKAVRKTENIFNSNFFIYTNVQVMDVQHSYIWANTDL